MEQSPPVHRSVRILATLLIVCTVVLLTLGALTTSFRAGMADPVWPTEPWFLIVNRAKYNLEEHRGFLLEHTHRAAGFTVGIVASLLALVAWGTMRGSYKARYGLVTILALLVAYGAFHGQMGKAWKLRQERQVAMSLGLELPQPDVFPAESGIATAASALLLLFVSAMCLTGQGPGKWVRFWVSVLLIAVMAQGLLGGYRVYLDQLFGPLLSQIHGTFAQLVFSLMCCLPILCWLPKPERILNSEDRDRLKWLALALPAAVFIQLIWGVMMRHTGSPLAQRLHMLSAFLVFGVALGVTMQILMKPSTKRQLAFGAYHLLSLLALQLVLGVEAYLGKFVSIGSQASIAPMAREITVESGVLRSLHVLLGTAILASSVVLALRIWRRTPNAYNEYQEQESRDR